MIYIIPRSIDKFLNNITDLNTYVYYNSFFDVSMTYTANSKVDLPLGTETTFIVVDNTNGSDLKNLENTLKNRYIKFTNPSTLEVSYIRISNYVVATGEITLASAFGIDRTTADTFQIVIRDSVFIDIGTSFEPYRRFGYTEQILPIFLHLHTKDDGSREKINDFFIRFKRYFIQNKKAISIYNDLDAIVGSAQCYGSVGLDQKENSGDQIQKFIISFQLSTKIKYE